MCIRDRAGSAALTHGLNGDAVVRARDMAPGGRTIASVTVENSGKATGAFRLAQVDVLDTPGTGGGRLSTQLRLRVDDAATGRAMYLGVLGKMNGASLGYVPGGEKRTYRFTLTPPAAGTGAVYAGSRVESTFDWTATTADPPARPSGPDTAPPTVVVLSTPGGGVALSCDEPCTVAGVAGGTVAGPRRRLRPGRPALLSVRRRRARRALRITVADTAGNRTTVPAPVTAR